jgi:hypothetical protein
VPGAGDVDAPPAFEVPDAGEVDVPVAENGGEGAGQTAS